MTIRQRPTNKGPRQSIRTDRRRSSLPTTGSRAEDGAGHSIRSDEAAPLTGLLRFFAATEIPEPPDPPDEERGPPSDSASDAPSRPWLQILSNYATLLVAVSAVVLSVWQGYEMRQHNRLSVLPNLDPTSQQRTIEKGERGEFRTQTVDTRTYVLRVGLENTGLGPAVIKEGLLFRTDSPEPLYRTQEEDDYLGVMLADSLVEQVRATFPEMERVIGGVRQGIMVKAGEVKPFLRAAIPAPSVPDTLDEYPPSHLRDLLGQFSFVVCYCSVYGEDCDHEHIGGAPPTKDVCDF